MNARVLVVDDEDDILKLLEAYLSSAGYEVETAQTAFEALKKIHSEKFDCVVTDMHLPNINGMELLNQVKKMNASLPVIFVSGQATESSKDHAKELGAFDFLEKPVGKDALIQCVRNALHGSAGEKAVPKLLVVDDQTDIHNFFKTVLSREGYDVKCVENGAQAIDAVLREHFDMVFMDMYMPVKSGLEAAKEIKSKKPEAFIVMMTGEAEESEMKKALSLDAGYKGILRKPLKAETLLLTVKNLFTEKEKYFEERAEKKRLEDRSIAESLKDEITEKEKQVTEVITSRSFKQKMLIVVISIIISFIALNFFVPLVDVASRGQEKVFQWMERTEGYLQRDEQRELRGK